MAGRPGFSSAISVIFATLIPYGLALMGLRYLKPAPASITMMLEPVMAGIFAYLLLGETLSGMQLAGCSLILAAVVALNLTQKPAGFSQMPESRDQRSEKDLTSL